MGDPPATADEAKVISLDRWAHHAVQTHDLPSGAGKVKARPVQLDRALIAGRLESPLLAEVARKYEYEGVNLQELDPEHLAAFRELQDWMIAEAVTEPAITPEQVASLPKVDQEFLWRIASHSWAEGVVEGLNSLLSLRKFRGLTNGGAAPADGEAAE